jgi:hypothetical protein
MFAVNHYVLGEKYKNRVQGMTEIYTIRWAVGILFLRDCFLVKTANQNFYFKTHFPVFFFKLCI